MSKKIPVLVLAFNRADHVEQAMISIAQYKPDRLYLECDGPRVHKDGEKEAVEATRKVMLGMVTWPCEVKTLFREENYGCAKSVNDAISWFFENEEYGIIVEDDIVLSPDFYTLCEDLLPRYKNNVSVQQIAAFNPVPVTNSTNTYTFTKRPQIWGWATWRRAWKHMDMQMTKWPQYSMWEFAKFYGYFQAIYMYRNWNRVYHHPNQSASWATRWNFAAFADNLVSISPCVNLAENIGFDGGTHYTNGDVNPYEKLCIGKITFPLSHPENPTTNKKQLRAEMLEFYRIRGIGLKKIIKKHLHG